MILKLFLTFVYLLGVAGLSVWLYVSYTDVGALSETVSLTKAKNSVLRSEVAGFEKRIEDARGRVQTLLSEQKRLEGESEKLKSYAAELEARWERAKQCKREFEEMSAEIETLRQQLSQLKSEKR